MTPTEILKAVDAVVVTEGFVVKALPIFRSHNILGYAQCLGLLVHAAPYLTAAASLDKTALMSELKALANDPAERKAIIDEIAKMSNLEGVPFQDVVTGLLYRVDQAVTFAQAVMGDFKKWFTSDAPKMSHAYALATRALPPPERSLTAEPDNTSPAEAEQAIAKSIGDDGRKA